MARLLLYTPTPRRWRVFFGWRSVVFLGALVGCERDVGRGEPVEQPIAFNHKLHVEKNQLGCTFCHKFVASEDYAGIPNIETCMLCHSSPIEGNAEASKVTGFVQRQELIPWRRMYRLRDYAHIPHANHIKAGVDCESCHGATGHSAVPIRDTWLTMDLCMDCHDEKGATTDCVDCHQ